MAKQNGKDDDDMPPLDHNVADVEKLIRNCASEMAVIKKERKELNERATEIRERLRESGVQPKAFDFACRVYEQEPEARNEYLDQLRVNFEALGIGLQADMGFPKLEGAAPTFVKDAAAG